MEARFGDELRTRWREEYLQVRVEVYPLPGATDLVRKLAGAGYRVALASSGDPEFSKEAAATLGIRNDIAVLTTSADAESSKPAPDLLGATLDKLGDVRRSVMVGDTPYDVEAADRAGMPCIALRSGGYSELELTKAGAVLVADAPEDLMDLDWELYLS